VRAVPFKESMRDLPHQPAGHDLDRPIVASLFAPMGTFEQLGMETAKREIDGNQPGPAANIHRIVFPATDPTAVSEALLSAIGKKLPSRGANTLGDDETVVRIKPQPTWVTVTVLSGERLAKITSSDIAKFPTAAATAADRLFASDEPALARVQIRMGILISAAPYMGMRMLEQAIGAAAKDWRTLIMMKGYSELLASQLVMDPSGAANTDVIAEVPASASSSLHIAMVLTDTGAKAFKADSKLASGVTVAADSLDWSAIVVAAPLPPIYVLADNPTAAGWLNLIEECGWACMLYALGANALSGLRVAYGGAPSELKDVISHLLSNAGGLSSAQVTLTESLLIVEALGAAASRFGKVTLPAAPPVSVKAGEVCYQALLHGLGQAFSGAANARDNARRYLDHFRNEQRDNLKCAIAAKDSNLADRATLVEKTVQFVETLGNQ